MDDQQRAADVQRVMVGDANALQRLIVHYHAAWRRAVDVAIVDDLRGRLDPEDILQRAYVAAFEAVTPLADVADVGCVLDAPSSGSTSVRPGRTLQFDSPAGFYTWLEAIALARLKDQMRALRRRKRDVAREVRDPHRPAGQPASYPDLLNRLTGRISTPSRHLAKDEAIAAVLSSLARLGDDQREVVRLRFLEGQPVAEVAERLGKTEAAVHMLCHRGLKALRGHLGPITNYLTHL